MLTINGLEFILSVAVELGVQVRMRGVSRHYLTQAMGALAQLQNTDAARPLPFPLDPDSGRNPRMIIASAA